MIRGVAVMGAIGLAGCGEDDPATTASSRAESTSTATNSDAGTAPSSTTSVATSTPSTSPATMAPPTTTTTPSSPTTLVPEPESLIGRTWQESTVGRDLGVAPGMSLAYQGALPIDGGLLGLHELVDPTTIADSIWGGHHLLLFSDGATGGGSSTEWTLTGVLDLSLADDEQLSLGHIGCSVGGVYEEGVFGVISPPVVDGTADLAAGEWPARAAWRYVTSGLPVEIDPEAVSCELAGEPPSGSANVDATTFERFVETVVGATFQSVRRIGQPDGIGVLPLPEGFTAAAGRVVDTYVVDEISPMDDGYHGRHVVVVSTSDADGVRTAVAAIPFWLSEDQFSSLALDGDCFVDGIADKNVWATLDVFDMSAIDRASVAQAWRYEATAQTTTELDPARVACTNFEGVHSGD